MILEVARKKDTLHIGDYLLQISCQKPWRPKNSGIPSLKYKQKELSSRILYLGEK